MSRSTRRSLVKRWPSSETHSVTTETPDGVEHLNLGYGQSDTGQPDAVSSVNGSGFGYTPYGARQHSAPVPTEPTYLEPLANPVRMYDSRDDAQSGLLSSGNGRRLDIGGHIADPVGVTAIVANITLVDADGRGSLRAWPDGHAQPSMPYVSTDGFAAIANMSM